CVGGHAYWNNRSYFLELKGGPNGLRTLGHAGSTLPTDYVVAYIASSQGDGREPDFTWRFPAPGATNVPVGTGVEIVFDEPVDPRTVNAANVRIDGVPGEVRYDPRTWTATIHPLVELEPNRTYTVRVFGVKDGPGNMSATPELWTFTTGPAVDAVPPAL